MKSLISPQILTEEKFVYDQIKKHPPKIGDIKKAPVAYIRPILNLWNK